MAQQHLDFTVPGGDKIKGAFQKTEANFTELFSGAASSEAVAIHTAPIRTKLVWAGDSLTAEDWEKPTIPTLLSRYASGGRFQTINVGYSGAHASGIDSNFAATVAPHAPVGLEKVILCVLIGTNDIASGATAAATYNSLKSIWEKARALGFEVCAMTLFARQDWAEGSAKDVARRALNDLIRGTPSLVDYIVNLDRLIPVYEWPLFMNAIGGLDMIHLGLAGRKLAARAVWDAFHQRQPWRVPRFRITLSTNRAFSDNVVARIAFDAIPVESPPCIRHDGGPDIMIPGDYAFNASVIAQYSPGSGSSFVECQVFVNDVFYKKLGRVQGYSAGVDRQNQIGGSFVLFNATVNTRVNLRIFTNNAAGCIVLGGQTDFEGYLIPPDQDIPTV